MKEALAMLLCELLDEKAKAEKEHSSGTSDPFYYGAAGKLEVLNLTIDRVKSILQAAGKAA